MSFRTRKSIKVAPGVYNENVTVTHTCEIDGAQAGNAFSGRTSGGPGESTVNSTSVLPSRVHPMAVRAVTWSYQEWPLP